MTEEQQKEFEKLTNPLIKFINDHGHPHMTIIIDNSSAELLSGEMCHRTEEFWKD